MDRELFNIIIDETSSEPYSRDIVFELHNEPLTDERTFQLIKYAKDKKEENRCTLVTNGQLINRFSPEGIIDSKLDRLTVSVNAHSWKKQANISSQKY